MSFFEKLTHISNCSKSDNSFKSEKITHKFWDDHKNIPLALNEKFVNSKMNKVETSENVVLHKISNVEECTRYFPTIAYINSA